MKAEIKKLWLDALRSGDYEKTTGNLKKDGKFCCLGVLTDLYIKETGNGCWEEAVVTSDEDINDDVTLCAFRAYGTAGPDEYYIPFVVQNWAGFKHTETVAGSDGDINITKYLNESDTNPRKKYALSEHASGITYINDSTAISTFNDIADILEEIV